MQEPMRTAAPRAGQTVVRQREHSAHDVVLRIPIAQPTAEQKREDGLHVVAVNFGAVAVVIAVAVADTADAAEAAGAATVSPKITVGSERRDPCAFIRKRRHVV